MVRRADSRAKGLRILVALGLAVIVLSPIYAGYLAVRAANPQLRTQSVWSGSFFAFVDSRTGLPLGYGPLALDPWALLPAIVCGAVCYQATGEPVLKGQCHCRECQYISGGHPNVVMGFPNGAFSYTKGGPKTFRRSDLPTPVAREFCAECGTHLLTRSPGLPGVVLVKVGTLDDPGVFDGPQMVIFTVDKQTFHHVPEGVPAFERVPG